MGRKARRNIGAEQKLKVIEEARTPGATAAAVLRRHQVDAASYYRWEREARSRAASAFSGNRRSKVYRRDEEIEQLCAELARTRELIWEIAEENLTLEEGL